MEKLFYRFGELPEDGISLIWKGNECIGREIGVSVYEAHLNRNGRYVPVIPNPMTEHTFDDYVYHINYFRGKHYLVTGDVIGIGSNGEPLLKNVKIVSQLRDGIELPF